MNYKDFDSSWKAVIDKFTEQFFEFYFYDIYTLIDFTEPFQFMDKELQKIFSRSKSGLKVADKLIKVKLKSGDDRIIFIHIEIQGENQKDFAKRMMWYNFRIRDKYDFDVISVALLTGSVGDVSNVFSFEMQGFSLHFEFPVVRINDYRNIVSEQYNSDNPFALLTLALLKSFETHGDNTKVMDWKFRLYKILIEKYGDYEYSRVILNFIDWIFILPDDLDEIFINKIHEIKEDRKIMAHVNVLERKAMEKGFEKGVEEGIEKGKFEDAKKMLLEGFDVEVISRITGLSQDEIRKLR